MDIDEFLADVERWANGDRTLAPVARAARERRGRGVSAAEAQRMIDEGMAVLAEMEARRAEQWERNRAARERAEAAYLTAQRRFEAEYGGPGLATRVAASWLSGPPPPPVMF